MFEGESPAGLYISIIEALQMSNISLQSVDLEIFEHT